MIFLNSAMGKWMRFGATLALMLTGTMVWTQGIALRTVTGLPVILTETSGLLVSSPNRLWSHNDGGNPPALYQFDTTGTLLRTLTLRGAGNEDWEDMTRDAAGNVYLGDFGNNLNQRHNLHIYKIADPDTVVGDSVTPGIIRFSYSDQTAFPPSAANMNFDMEAMAAFGDSLYLFSKNRTSPFNGFTKMYRLPQDTGTFVAELVDSFFCGPGGMLNNWITAAAFSPNGEHLALLSHDRMFYFSCFPGSNFFGGANVKRTFAFSQKEGIAWKDSSHILMTDELLNGVFGRNLYEIDASALVAEPVADLGPDTVYYGDTLWLGSPNWAGTSYVWNGGQTTPTLPVTQSGTYSVQVTTPNGCSASDTVQVSVLADVGATLAGALHLQAGPNPFSEQCTLRALLPRWGTLSWQVLDPLGRTLSQGSQLGEGPINWSIGNNLEKGTYLMTYQFEGKGGFLLLIKN
jgi:hypothetical protein